MIAIRLSKITVMYFKEHLQVENKSFQALVQYICVYLLWSKFLSSVGINHSMIGILGLVNSKGRTKIQ